MKSFETPTSEKKETKSSETPNREGPYDITKGKR
jgi:hypothetical protein